MIKQSDLSDKVSLPRTADEKKKTIATRCSLRLITHLYSNVSQRTYSLSLEHFTLYHALHALPHEAVELFPPTPRISNYNKLSLKRFLQAQRGLSLAVYRLFPTT